MFFSTKDKFYTFSHLKILIYYNEENAFLQKSINKNKENMDQSDSKNSSTLIELSELLESSLNKNANYGLSP
jgi:thiamine biosynthesis lipoprotein ApbE